MRFCDLLTRLYSLSLLLGVLGRLLLRLLSVVSGWSLTRFWEARKRHILITVLPENTWLLLHLLRNQIIRSSPCFKCRHQSSSCRIHRPSPLHLQVCVLLSLPPPRKVDLVRFQCDHLQVHFHGNPTPLVVMDASKLKFPL